MPDPGCALAMDGGVMLQMHHEKFFSACGSSNANRSISRLLREDIAAAHMHAHLKAFVEVVGAKDVTKKVFERVTDD
jgi:hypothetical protein